MPRSRRALECAVILAASVALRGRADAGELRGRILIGERPAAGVTVSALVDAEGDIYADLGTGTQALVELHLVIDGVVVRVLRASSTNLVLNKTPSPWHLGTIQPLGPGSHEFHVEAEILYPFTSGAVVTANNAPGNLSVALLRQ